MRPVYSVWYAKQFLRSQGITVGDAIVLDWIPGPPEMAEYIHPGEQPSSHVVGFCKLPVISRHRPELVSCLVEFDISVECTEENPFPLKVTFFEGRLKVPQGSLAALDCVDICRETLRNDPLGFVVGTRLEGRIWTILFQHGVFSGPEFEFRCPDCYAIKVDDKTGRVLSVFL